MLIKEFKFINQATTIHEDLDLTCRKFKGKWIDTEHNIEFIGKWDKDRIFQGKMFKDSELVFTGEIYKGKVEGFCTVYGDFGFYKKDKLIYKFIGPTGDIRNYSDFCSCRVMTIKQYIIQNSNASIVKASYDKSKGIFTGEIYIGSRLCYIGEFALKYVYSDAYSDDESNIVIRHGKGKCYIQAKNGVIESEGIFSDDLLISGKGIDLNAQTRCANSIFKSECSSPEMTYIGELTYKTFKGRGQLIINSLLSYKGWFANDHFVGIEENLETKKKEIILLFSKHGYDVLKFKLDQEISVFDMTKLDTLNFKHSNDNQSYKLKYDFKTMSIVFPMLVNHDGFEYPINYETGSYIEDVFILKMQGEQRQVSYCEASKDAVEYYEILKDNKLVSVITFKTNTGDYTIFKNGKMYMQGSFVNGKPNGICTIVNDTSEFTCNFKDGDAYGVATIKTDTFTDEKTLDERPKEYWETEWRNKAETDEGDGLWVPEHEIVVDKEKVPVRKEKTFPRRYWLPFAR